MTLDSFRQDVRYGLRLLGRQRANTAIAILTLALATGATAAIFSVIDAALLRPLPYPRPEQIVTLSVTFTRDDGRPSSYAPSLDDVRAWNAPGSPLTRVAVERTVFPERVFDAGAPERVESMRVSEQYFPLFGVTPALGRLFTADDTAPGAPGTIVLNHGFWMSRFGGDPGVVNRLVRYDGEPATIVGVLPPEFGRTIPVWRALQEPADRQDNRGSGWTVLGRLAGNATIESAPERLTAQLAPSSERQVADGVRVRSFLASTRSSSRTTVTIIASAVLVIVLLACVNVAGLLLARGAARQAELATRVAMGATRRRLVSQLLIESLVLAGIGGIAGVGLAYLTLQAIVANLPMSLPGDTSAAISPLVLGATTGAVILNGLLFGLVPALRLSQASSARALAGAGRQHATGLSRRGGQWVIAIEVALAVVMLAGAGLMLRSFIRLTEVDLGFDPAAFVTLKVQPLDQDSATTRLYYPALIERLRMMPDVEEAGAIDYVPLADGARVTSARRPGGEWEQMIQIQTAAPGYFETVGIAPRRGRLLDPAGDAGTTSVVINETAAQTFYPDGTALGQRLESPVSDDGFLVVGIVPDARHWGPRSDASPAIYRLFGPDTISGSGGHVFTVVVRPRPGARNLAAQLREAAESIGTPVVVDGVRTGSAWLGDRIDTPRRRTVLLNLLGGLGLLLAMVGVLGVTSYAVGRRAQEIGIRLALGARPGDVVRRVLRDSLWPVAIGVVAGTGAALLSTRVIRTFLFETSPTDAVTLALVAAALLVVGGLAAWIPARRAARIDPASALRAE